MEFVDNVANRLNLLTDNKWLAIIPTQPALLAQREGETSATSSLSGGNMFFNLTDFTMGAIEIASANADYMGYTIEMPIPFVRSSSKTATFSYIMDSNLQQYIFLNNWLNAIVHEDGTGMNPNIKDLSEIMTPVRVLILSEFKTPIMEVTYEDSWLQAIGQVNFTYKGNADVVTSSFTIKYSRISFSTNVSNYLN